MGFGVGVHDILDALLFNHLRKILHLFRCFHSEVGGYREGKNEETQRGR